MNLIQTQNQFDKLHQVFTQFLDTMFYLAAGDTEFA